MVTQLFTGQVATSTSGILNVPKYFSAGIPFMLNVKSVPGAIIGIKYVIIICLF